MTVKHTPGPWRWTKQFTGMWALMGGRSLLVMDFVRIGMRHAQPRFSDRAGEARGGVMHNAEDLDLSTHPDAMLMEDGPALLDALDACLANTYTGDDVRLLAVGVGGVLPPEIHAKCDAMNASHEAARALLRKHGRLAEVEAQ